MKKCICLISLLVVLLLVGCRRSYYTPSEQSLLDECKIERTETKLDDNAIDRIESLACNVKSWKDEDILIHNAAYTHQYPWDHVALSILQNPDEVKFSNDRCIICGNQTLVVINFHSPSITWENMCGTAGNLTICTNCKKQLDFHCTMMN